jgi:hypothetical protein
MISNYGGDDDKSGRVLISEDGTTTINHGHMVENDKV